MSIVNKRLEPLRQQKSSALASILLLKLIMDAVMPAHPGKRACVCVGGGGGGGGGKISDGREGEEQEMMTVGIGRHHYQRMSPE